MRGLLEAAGKPLIDDFIDPLQWSMTERQLSPSPLECLAHLPQAARNAAGPAGELSRVLAANCRSLRWGQTYAASDFGDRFLKNYGWTELFGTRGHFANDTIAGGFLLLGPGITYPDHHHVAEEIYVPLTGGTEWRMDDGPFAVRDGGSIIHHRSNVGHAMRTGAEPLLALYLWRGGPLDQRSDIGRSTGA
jgi:hypothetical protein